MISTKKIPLFYWSEIKFIFKTKENYGDLLSKYLVEKISGKEVRWVHPKKQRWYQRDKKNFLVIGSIIHHANNHSVVWGSGIIDQSQSIAKAKFRAVRGPRTREYLIKLGYECSKIYGDPAILLPKFYYPEVPKKYDLGIIPHYHDYERAKELFSDKPNILVIDLMTMDVENVTRKILACKKTLSSSLHGLIVSHAYGIPSLWVEFSNKIFGNGIKYLDYFESIEIPLYKPEFIDRKLEAKDINMLFEKFPVLPQKEKTKRLQKKLMDSCPFI